MEKLGYRNYSLISRGIRTEGSFNPKLIFYLFEEQLLVDEVDTIRQFLSWVNEDEDNRAFGYANYEIRFQQFLYFKQKENEQDQTKSI